MCCFGMQDGKKHRQEVQINVFEQPIAPQEPTSPVAVAALSVEQALHAVVHAGSGVKLHDLQHQSPRGTPSTAADAHADVNSCLRVIDVLTHLFSGSFCASAC